MRVIFFSGFGRLNCLIGFMLCVVNKNGQFTGRIILRKSARILSKYVATKPCLRFVYLTLFEISKAPLIKVSKEL